MRLFHIFRGHVVPYMSDFFDRDFWEISMLNGIQTYPAAWYASLAVGAMYQQLHLRHCHGEPSPPYQQLYYERAALTYCNKTARLLVEADHTNLVASEREMLLLSCILLTCYANLRRDSAQTLMHIYNGVYLSKKWRYWQHSLSSQHGFRLPNCVIPVSSINMLFRRLEMQLFSSPFKLPESLESLDRPITISTEIAFKTAVEAYIDLQPIANAYRKLYHQSSQSGVDKLALLQVDSAKLREPFELWRQKFLEFKKVFSDQEVLGQADSSEAYRVQVLTVWEACGNAIYFVDASKGELSWDDFNDEFERGINICEYLLDGSPLGRAHASSAWLPNLSCFMSLMGQALGLLSSACRIPTIRRRAMRLLRKYPFIDGTAESAFITIFTEAKMKFEEDGWERTPIEGGCDCVADVFVCREHRIPSATIQPHMGGSIITLKSVYETANGLPGSSVVILPSKGK